MLDAHELNGPDQKNSPCFCTVATVQKAARGVKWEAGEVKVFHSACALCFRRQEAVRGDAEQTADRGGRLPPF